MKAIHLRAILALMLALGGLSLTACSGDPQAHTPGPGEYNNRNGGA